MTGGSYHLAASADELQDVFQNLPTQLMTVTETTEVSVMFVVVGALWWHLRLLFRSSGIRSPK